VTGSGKFTFFAATPFKPTILSLKRTTPSPEYDMDCKYPEPTFAYILGGILTAEVLVMAVAIGLCYYKVL
jgi:hypothetical protein